MAPLLDQIEGGIAKMTADGAYDRAPTHATITAHGDDIEVVIPPWSTVEPGDEQGDDGSLQGTDRSSIASTRLRCTAD